MVKAVEPKGWVAEREPHGRRSAIADIKKFEEMSDMTLKDLHAWVHKIDQEMTAAELRKSKGKTAAAKQAGDQTYIADDKSAQGSTSTTKSATSTNPKK